MEQKDFYYTDYDGGTVLLNLELAKKQGCTHDDMLGIMDAHRCRVEVFAIMSGLNANDVVALRHHADKVESLEFLLQAFWHFEQDKTKHSFWYKLPFCTCPKIDNGDSMYKGHRIIVEGCPIHWTGDNDVAKKPLSFWQRMKRKVGL